MPVLAEAAGVDERGVELVDAAAPDETHVHFEFVFE